jgi:hypothetical protein
MLVAREWWVFLLRSLLSSGACSALRQARRLWPKLDHACCSLGVGTLTPSQAPSAGLLGCAALFQPRWGLMSILTECWAINWSP